MNNIELQWGPWSPFSYEKVKWFYDNKNWDMHFKHFLVLGPMRVTWRSVEHCHR